MKRCAFVLFVYSISAFGMLPTEDGAAPNNCTESERALFDDHDFGKFWADCTSVFGLKVSEFREGYPEIGDSCMGCIVDMTNCGIHHCKRKCAPWPIGYGATSKECKKCSRDNCGETFDTCAASPSN